MRISSAVFPASIIITASLILYSGSILEAGVLAKLVSMVTMASLVAAPLAYFWKKQLNEAGERSRASANLYTELDDVSMGLDRKNNAADLKGANLPEGRTVYFMNRMLNHDFYDSLVYSGRINFLPPRIQQSVQDVFRKIKNHNLYMSKIREIEDNAAVDEDVSEKKARYYRLLAKTEEGLLDDTRMVKKELRREFRLG